VVAGIKEIVLAAILATGEAHPGIANIDPAEAECLAQTVYHEARGEDLLGQIAVASVVLNRSKDPTRAPNRNSICTVVYEPGQFTWARRNRNPRVNDLASFRRAAAVATMTLSGTLPDVTNGAQFFHTTDTGRLPWTVQLVPADQHGRHAFYRPRYKMASSSP
jgi:spore germination cell wall hydrolase CwlJ-like protein